MCSIDEDVPAGRAEVREVQTRAYLQEGDEVLLHQVVAAGVHEQMDEPGSVVVTVLQDPAAQGVSSVCTHVCPHRPPQPQTGPEKSRSQKGRHGGPDPEVTSFPGCPRWTSRDGGRPQPCPRPRPGHATQAQDSLSPHGNELVHRHRARALSPGPAEERCLPVQRAAAGLQGEGGERGPAHCAPHADVAPPTALPPGGRGPARLAQPQMEPRPPRVPGRTWPHPPRAPAGTPRPKTPAKQSADPHNQQHLRGECPHSHSRTLGTMTREGLLGWTQGCWDRPPP